MADFEPDDVHDQLQNAIHARMAGNGRLVARASTIVAPKPANGGRFGTFTIDDDDTETSLFAGRR